MHRVDSRQRFSVTRELEKRATYISTRIRPHH